MYSIGVVERLREMIFAYFLKHKDFLLTTLCTLAEEGAQEL